MSKTQRLQVIILLVLHEHKSVRVDELEQKYLNSQFKLTKSHKKATTLKRLPSIMKECEFIVRDGDCYSLKNPLLSHAELKRNYTKPRARWNLDRLFLYYSPFHIASMINGHKQWNFITATSFLNSLDGPPVEHPVITPNVTSTRIVNNETTYSSIVIVNTKEQFDITIAELHDQPVYALDCEGVNLGKFGELCLVQLAANKKQYLFDIRVGDPALKVDMMTYLKHVFEDESKLKIFHDCRQDSSALFHQYNIRMRNVADCQVIHQLLTQNLNEEISYNNLCRKYSVEHNIYKNRTRSAMRGNNELWKQRPMTDLMINYAAADVKSLEALYNCMISSSAGSLTVTDVVSASSKYVNFYLSESHSENIEKPVSSVLAQSKNVDSPVSATVQQLDTRFQIVNQTDELLTMLPNDVRSQIVSACGDNLNHLIEIAMDKDRPYELFFYNSKQSYYNPNFIVSIAHVEHLTQQLQFASDKRSGIEGTLHRISAMHNRLGQTIGLTLRIGRAVMGLATVIEDIIQAGESILLLGVPGSGKTTIIRDISRIMAESRRVIIVDTSCEIGGFGDVPHIAVGRARRMQVPDIHNQQEVMVQAVQNHTPEVIVIDEIGTQQEVSTARTIAQRGVVLCASAHGSMHSIMKNPILSELLGGVESVIISDRAAAEFQGEKMRLQLKNTPIFDAVVELSAENESEWKIYRNVKTTVQNILAGKMYSREVRTIDLTTNTVTIYEERVDPLLH